MSDSLNEESIENFKMAFSSIVEKKAADRLNVIQIKSKLKPKGETITFVGKEQVESIPSIYSKK